MSEPVIHPKPEETLTGAEQLELAKLRNETAAHQKRTAELEAQNRDLVMKDTVTKAIAGSGIRSRHTDADLFTLLSKEEGVKIVPSADGSTLHCEKDGKEIEFKDLVEQYAVKHQSEFDGRTLRHLIEHAPDTITSLEDLPTRADRIAYIAKHGEDAFARLGQYKVPTLDASKLTASDWKHMTIAQKTAVVDKHGAEIVSKILKRTGEQK